MTKTYKYYRFHGSNPGGIKSPDVIARSSSPEIAFKRVVRRFQRYCECCGAAYYPGDYSEHDTKESAIEESSKEWRIRK